MYRRSRRDMIDRAIVKSTIGYIIDGDGSW